MMVSAKVLGIPTEYVEKLPVISCSGGFFRWKAIKIGADFLKLSEREQQAVLMHEVAHCKLMHLERRILNLWRGFWFPALISYCRAQEFEADHYAALAGYGVDLAILYRRVERAKHTWYALHPDVDERVDRLLGR